MRAPLVLALFVLGGCSVLFDPDAIRLAETETPDAGTCANACVLPAPTCSGATLVVPADPFCRDDGRCAWSTSETSCPQGCADGKCIGDPCLGVRCDARPASACADATHLTTYANPGSCSDGACSYAATTTTCAQGCANGRCLEDPCLGVTCQSPPPATCADAATLRTWATNGTCRNGECTYAPADSTCPAGCANGACRETPCTGKTCASPPAASCVDGSTLRTYAVNGSCDPASGSCSYTASTTACTGGKVCSGGACVTAAPGCSASNCAGCCSGSTCIAISSESAQQCGSGGQACGACGSGYGCSGGKCADIDECATSHGGCSANATCTNTPGGHTCSCNFGFTGDGVTCTDVRGRLSGGRLHTCAVGSDGKARCWGGNYYGQLGDSSFSPYESDVPIVATEFGTSVAQVAAGNDFTCALTTSGAVKCVGYDDRGQLGASGTSSRTAVTAMASGAVSITAGGKHACAVTTGGGVKCWGNDSYGQLGNGSTAGSLGATAVSGLSSGVVAVAAGSFHSCALLANGTVKCWGRNIDGEVGDGTTAEQDAPVAVTGLSGLTIVAIDAAQRNTCALASTGDMYCWGDNDSGQLGRATLTDSATPILIALSGVRGLAVGGMVLSDAYWDFACAITAAGGSSCWGNDSLGQLGDGTNNNRVTPGPPTNLAAPIALLDCGDGHCCALTTEGERWCWGDGSDGQLGRGSQVSSNVPVRVQAF